MSCQYEVRGKNILDSGNVGSSWTATNLLCNLKTFMTPVPVSRKKKKRNFLKKDLG